MVQSQWRPVIHSAVAGAPSKSVWKHDSPSPKNNPEYKLKYEIDLYNAIVTKMVMFISSYMYVSIVAVETAFYRPKSGK